VRTAKESSAAVESELRPLDANFADAELNGGAVAVSSASKRDSEIVQERGELVPATEAVLNLTSVSILVSASGAENLTVRSSRSRRPWWNGVAKYQPGIGRFCSRWRSGPRSRWPLRSG